MTGMASYRVSRPRFSAAWTSHTQIGREFDGNILTPDAYIAVESVYIDVADHAHKSAGRPGLAISGVECPNAAIAPVPGETVNCEQLRDGAEFPAPRLPELIRTCLREIAWYRIVATNREFEVHFGWDYTMYVICPSEMPAELVAEAERRGVQVELAPSPHWPKESP